MQEQQISMEQLKINLKNQFAKTYKIRQGRSLLEIKQKNKIHSKHNSSYALETPKDKKVKHTKLNKSQIHNQDFELQQTLRQLNFSHHAPDTCQCNNCLCGRHLCKLNVIKPNLKKNTIYQKCFVPQKIIQSQVVQVFDTKPLKAGNLNLQTEYHKQYKNRQKDPLQRPHPKDSLKFAGPPQQITTYGHFFPGHHGQNQYIKPTDKHTRGEFPLFGKTIYSTEYLIKNKGVELDFKEPDHLRTGYNWLGSTTYNNSFKINNPQQAQTKPSNFKQSQKYQINPDISNHFDTNYKKEYFQKPSPICPSKIQFQTGRCSHFNGSKSLYQQNSDFKSMSPQFQAISTSKHFYV